jgi:hypothetical protein
VWRRRRVRAPTELRLSLRDAIQAAIDNNVNVRSLKKPIAAAQAQADTSLGIAALHCSCQIYELS